MPWEICRKANRCIRLLKIISELIQQNRHIRQYKLPSENQLAFKFKCSRITVQRALTNLENEGIIYRMQGKGTFARRQNRLRWYIPAILGLYAAAGHRASLSREIINGANEYLRENGVELYVSLTNNDASLEKEKIETAVSRITPV